MKQIIFVKTRTTRVLHKRHEIQGGFTTLPDGHEEIWFSTEMDWDALFDLARKAAASKGQTARDGALRVKVIERRRIP